MSSECRTVELPTPDATERFGRQLGQLLWPGAVVGLSGPLGAGKTFLSRTIALGLDVSDQVRVTSPTYILVQEYPGRLPIYHFDLYRLKSANDFFELGGADYLEGDGVCLIEWADKFPEALPPHRLDVRLEPTGETSRRLQLVGGGERYAALIRTLIID
ncbi:tRNA (adenosine(37)-N6)-threonylcarbamoyltransferase complex ATPase subunit type 1 TsaE [soil metagenome]